MATIDWIVLGTYIAAMIVMSVYLGRGQESADDYYVGGRNLPWWAVGISTMATQTSANSFIGIPAYVALKEGGAPLPAEAEAPCFAKEFPEVTRSAP